MPKETTQPFVRLLQMQERFYNDRPLMKRHNTNLAEIAHLLASEVEELNGHTEDGIPLDKYREQELSDIGWFALGMAYIADFSPHVNMIQQQSTPVAEDYVWDEEQYEQVKQEMMAALEPIAWLLQEKEVTKYQLTIEQHQKIAEVVTVVLGKAWTIFSMLGVDAEKALAEKMARNNVKHKKRFYTNADGDYAKAVKKANREWKQKLLPINHDPNSKRYVLNEVRTPGDPRFYKKDALPGNPMFYEVGAYVPTYYDPKEWVGKDHGTPLPLVPVSESLDQFLREPATIATR